jgi:predicted DNA-binding mobile mystery protein A
MPKKISPEASALMRAQLDSRIRQARALRELPQPKAGWINAIRCALGMSASQLAHRLGMTVQGVADLERREANATITIGKLREAANALDADAVVLVVPRRSLAQAVRERATAKAEAESKRIAHTMQLEEQAAGTRGVLHSKLREQEWLNARLGELWD